MYYLFVSLVLGLLGVPFFKQENVTYLLYTSLLKLPLIIAIISV